MPDSYLLDTNIITALAQGDATAQTHLRGLQAEDTVDTCSIVAGEWEYGLRHAPGRKRQAQIQAAGAPIFAALTAVWALTPDIALR